MDDLKLCFIKRVHGDDENCFRLYFTNNIDDVVGDDWDVPCADVVSPPYKEYIKEVINIKIKKFDLELLEENEFFRYNDGADGIIALGWEYSEDELTHKRLVFYFGETKKEIHNKLYNREIPFED